MDPDTTSSQQSNYAHLPEELLASIMLQVPETVDRVNSLMSYDDESITKGIETLRNKDLIKKISSTDSTDSLVAVDGGLVLEKMTGMDLVLALAVGVEGLSEDRSVDWGSDKNQYISWQWALPHHEANARLIQGVMFLMELSVLAGSAHEVRIMDGSHLTSILKINSMLSAKDDGAGEEYIEALKQFLKTKYEKVIPDIPNIIQTAFANDNIVASTKYSSSTDVIDFHLQGGGITVDDKTFFMLGLGENEYLKPQPVGRSKKEDELWGQLHIVSNLDFQGEVNETEFNRLLKEAIQPIKTRDAGGNYKEPDLFYTYYKPFDEGPAYRLEIKRSVAEDTQRLEKVLNSIRKQVIFPEIIEPYPQYLVDLMAKSVAGGMYAIKEAILLSPNTDITNGKFNLLRNYRT